MIKNIRHTGIVVDNLEKSLSFYRDLLGFKITKQLEESSEYLDTVLNLKGATVTTVKMKAPDQQLIELLFFSSQSNQKENRTIYDVGISHIAFSVDDVDGAHQLLIKAGIECVSSSQVSPDGFAKVFFCRAPEGTFVELVQEL